MAKPVDAVTGATGFTGGALARRLLADGRRVRALVRRTSHYQELERAGAELVFGDICDSDAARECCTDAERVFHVAALYREAKHKDDEYFRVNRDGATCMLNAARTAGVKRFVHCSTVGVLGDVQHPPADETAPLAPGDVYQVSKLEGEQRALQAAQKGDLHVVVLRPAGIYGPGDMRFHKIFKMVRKGRFFILGRGETLYHAVYIDDLIDAFLLAASRPVESGSIYIIAGESYLSMNEFVAEIAGAVGGRRWIPHFPVTPFRWLGALTESVCIPLGIDPPIHRRRVEFFTKNRAFRIDRAMRQLGFAPRVSMAEGLARTAAWYRAEGLL